MTDHMDPGTPAILFVDDESKALKYFRLAIGKRYEILTASNVPEARAVLEEHAHRIGVVVSDQRMPGESGVDLLDDVRLNYPHIVRILTTAYSELEDAIAAVNRGEIFRYLTKPWDVPLLQAEINQAVEYFQLRRERDALLQEKFSVRQSLAIADRARDMMVLAHGVTGLRNTEHGVYNFLDNLLEYLGCEQNSEVNLDLWGLFETESQRSMSIGRILAQGLSDLPERGDQGLSAESLRDIMAEAMPGAAMPSGWISLEGDAARLKLLLKTWVTAVLAGRDDAVSIALRNEGGVLQLQVPLLPEAPMSETTQAHWLLAYLLCADHGGELRVSLEGCSLSLPSRPQSLSGLDQYWLDNLMGRLEML